MSLFLTLAYLFFVGSVFGWFLELFYRRFFSKANPEHKWINPGFCTGPYVPLYGEGLCILYLLASLEPRIPINSPAAKKAVLFLVMAICMTGIEYLAGILCLKVAKVRLWDYSMLPGNIQGLICPQFSLIWALGGAGYYFGIHPHILEALQWLSENLAFSFVIGFFFGVFTIDVSYSAHLVVRMREFAVEHDVIVQYESLKYLVHTRQKEFKEKDHFFFPLHSVGTMSANLRFAYDSLKEATSYTTAHALEKLEHTRSNIRKKH